jgi:hypothetical protein
MFHDRPSGAASVALVLVLVGVMVMPVPGLAATLTVTDFGDSNAAGQLRTLVATAAAGGVVEIGEGVVNLTLGILFIDQQVSLRGAGADRTFVDLSQTHSVLVSASVSMAGLTIRRGGNAAIRNSSSDSNLALQDVVVRDSQGGGIINFNGTLTMFGGALIGNEALYGGGLETEGGRAALTNVTVSGNRARFFGGGSR